YTYDLQGRMKTMTTQGADGPAVTTWNYDPARGWLASKIYDDEKGTAYDYYPSGRLALRNLARTNGGNPLTTSYSYNNAGELTVTDYSDSTPDITRAYNRTGQLAEVDDAQGNRTFDYRTSGDQRLQSETMN